MIIELPNILDKNSCEDIIQFYDEHPDRWQKSDVQERFIDCSMMTHKLVGPVLQSVAALTNRLIIKAAKFYHLEELYLDFQTINRWEAGKDMPLHADNMTPEKEPHWYCGQRDYSSILYLNHKARTIAAKVNGKPKIVNPEKRLIIKSLFAGPPS